MRHDAKVLCGTEFRVPEGRIFDSLPGEVVVQRCSLSILSLSLSLSFLGASL